jgi:hypothetical protein
MSRNYITVTMVAEFLAGSCNANNVLASDVSLDYYVGNKIQKKPISLMPTPPINEYTSDYINNIQPISYIDRDEDVLMNFVGSIIVNTKNLDSDFSKFVDDNFWDLV